MKKYALYTFVGCVAILSLVACSTSKNTWTSRNYQAMHTKFNVFFNGAISYKDGLQNIAKANQDDYSSIIPMYPISHHSNASSASVNMDRTIEKCRKAIKLHSIKKKPEKNYKKINSPEYQRFYNQEEFNPQMKNAWLYLAQAEFHKADFLGSAATFSYIAKHYAGEKDVVITCQIWIARAYAEMDWLYEAEDVLAKLNQNDIKGKNIGLFAAVNADLLLKKKLYKEAIPFLKLAISKESNTSLKVRFTYLLGQLYQRNGEDKLAYSCFTSVSKSNPPYEMDFNARIAKAMLNQGDVEKVRKELKRMLRNKNNKDYQDQLYFALAKTYLQHADTTSAISNLKLSAENSKRNGIDKAISLITLGDLYYVKRNYVSAQPCYDEAGKIITADHPDYQRVTRLGQTLSELVTQNDIVVLQDSLQRLSKLSEADRLTAVKKVIEKLVADEKAAAEKEQQKNRPDIENEDVPVLMPPIGAAGNSDWYFYNPTLMKSGNIEFQKRWGRRKLEDNWRRTNKTSTLFTENKDEAESAATDTTGVAGKSKEKELTDNKKPEFYLKQIPVTPAQLKKSDAEIATALFNMGFIYLEKIEDYPLAVNTFDEFARRFPNDQRIADGYFQLYMVATRNGKTAEADIYKNKLLTGFPESKQSKLLSQKDFNGQLAAMNAEQDSLYLQTYKAYNKSDFNLVFDKVAYVQKKYPLSPLMPKFMFLNALSIGKKQGGEKFETALNELVTKYPTSDVSTMSKDILALMKQGQKATTGTSTGASLLAKREEQTKQELKEISPVQFSSDKRAKHRLMLVCQANPVNMYRLQFDLASFNFSRFLIKEYDVTIAQKDSLNSTISVTNFDSYDEVEWYLSSLNSEAKINQKLNDYKAQRVVISDENYAVVKANDNLKDYQAFIAKQTPGKKEVATNSSTKNTAKKLELSVEERLNAIKSEVSAQLKNTEAKTEKTTQQANTDSKATKPGDKATVPTTTPAAKTAAGTSMPTSENKTVATKSVETAKVTTEKTVPTATTDTKTTKPGDKTTVPTTTTAAKTGAGTNVPTSENKTVASKQVETAKVTTEKTVPAATTDTKMAKPGDKTTVPTTTPAAKTAAGTNVPTSENKTVAAKPVETAKATTEKTVPAATTDTKTAKPGDKTTVPTTTPAAKTAAGTNVPTSENKTVATKPVETAKATEKTVPAATTDTKTAKPGDKTTVPTTIPAAKTATGTTVPTTDSKGTTNKSTEKTPATTKSSEPEVPLFKGLFGFRATEPHYVAIYILSGSPDIEKIKAAVDAYNKQNFAAINLKISIETSGNQKLILIGTLADAAAAKAYLYKIVKEKSITDLLKSVDYRNVLGGHKNLSTMMQQNALNVYFDFMKEYYLK